MAKRKFRPRSRSNAIRDPQLVIIATEGAKTEPIYFKDMVSPQYYQNSKTHVEVLSGSPTNRSLAHVLEMLDDFKREYHLNRHDELWMVIDFDRWGEEKLGNMALLCRQKGYQLAVSPPCFELWLLLHLRSLADYSTVDLQEMLANERITKKKTRLEQELTQLLGSYHKEKLKTSAFLPFVHIAIDRARQLDTTPEHRWPHGLGSRVYLLVEKITHYSHHSFAD